MLRLLAIASILAACGRTAVAPTAVETFYQPLVDQDVPRIEILPSLDSATTPQQPMNLEDALQFPAGTWWFEWTSIDDAERYVLDVYDFTMKTEEYREGAGPFAEVETTETRATVELAAGRLYIEVAAFNGLTLVGKSQAWAIEVRWILSYV